MENTENTNLGQEGSVEISEEVVAVIASVAAAEVQGVHAISNTISGGIAEMFGKKNQAKGVKIDIDEQNMTASIDVALSVDYGCRIQDVAASVQERVKNSVENMTGLHVVRVNVRVDAVIMEQEAKPQPQPQQ